MIAEDVFRNVTGGVPSGRWAGMTADRLYSSESWLRFCVADVGGRTTTGVVEANGVAVPVTAVDAEPNPFYQWHTQLSRRSLPSPAPSGLLVGPRRGYQTHLLHSPTAGDGVERLLEQLSTLHKELGGSEYLPSTPARPAPCLGMFLNTTDVHALQAAGVSTTPVLLTTDAWIAVPEGGWQEWLRSLPSKGRRDSVKQEVKAFTAAGYEVSRTTLAESFGTAARLLVQTQKRYGQPSDLQILTESFRRQAAAMGPAAQVLLCHRSGEPPVGFCLFYIHGTTLYVRAVGFDYDRLSGAAEYFNLVYYETVRLAGESGLRWVHPGIESPDAKAIRGAELRPLWLLDLTEDSVLRDSGHAVRAHNTERVRQLTHMSPAVAKALVIDQCLPFC